MDWLYYLKMIWSFMAGLLVMGACSFLGYSREFSVLVGIITFVAVVMIFTIYDALNQKNNKGGN